MSIRLYDSYSRSIREFSPLEGDTVRLYCCGPTVYDYAHIGNLRTYIFEDLLRRTLEFYGYRIQHVMNITDVGHLTSDADTGEDKIEKGARRTGKSAWEIAELYTRAFKSDLAALNIIEPDIWCRATDHIAEQIADIQRIEAKGLTYKTSDGVYFDTSGQAEYGHLARLDIAGLQAGQRVDIGEKRHPTDFALWKFSPEPGQRQMEWDSPWGRGFPGWHIECSAMAIKYLGPWFDIHCGGKDHIPVHHCNEIAQAEACYGTRMANFWLHGYFLEADRGKMAKSSGEFLRLQTLLDRGIDPLAYRYLCLTANYRHDLKFSWDSLESAAVALGRLRQSYYDWQGRGAPDADYLARFTANIYDDLNIAKALAVVWELARADLAPGIKKATMARLDQILGLGLADWQPASLEIPEDIQSLANERTKARTARDWPRADAIREQLAQRGFEVEDSPDGSVIRPK